MAKDKLSITQDDIKRLVHYDPKTGLLTWLPRQNWSARNLRHAGRPAGRRHHEGYVVLTILGIYMSAHRLIWFYMTGEWPTERIDHENTIRDDNRWDNLRLATNSQNLLNRGKTKANKSGFKGVRLHKASGLWAAAIRVEGKMHYLGYFRDPKTASEAYRTAAIRLAGDFARVD